MRLLAAFTKGFSMDKIEQENISGVISNFFDENYYIKSNPDVKKSNIKPIFHYIKYGENEGRNPSRYFDVELYRTEFNLSKEFGVLVHAIESGYFSKQNKSIKMNKLLFFPSYQATNPYQELLYSKFYDDFDVFPGTIKEALQLAVAGEKVVFHLHWPEPLMGGCVTEDDFLARSSEILFDISLFRNLGGKFIVTAHNVLPHDKNKQVFWKNFLTTLYSYSSIVHIHSKKAGEILNETFKIPFSKFIVAGHGNFIDAYPNKVSKELARKKLGLDSFGFIFGFVGQLRFYKGIEKLFNSFVESKEMLSNAALVIAGKPVQPMPTGYWNALAENFDSVKVFEGYIEDGDLQLYINASDVIVLPYHDILTSGSLMLAESFGKPVIIPEIDVLEEYIKERHVIGYNPKDPEGLRDALYKVRYIDKSTYIKMCKSSFEYAKKNNWPEISSNLCQELKNMLAFDFYKRKVSGYNVLCSDTSTVKLGSIGICIVNYNSSYDLVEFIKTVPTSVNGVAVSLFVLDNSEPNSNLNFIFDIFPSVVLIKSDTNTGYAGGNNICIDLMCETGCSYGMIANCDIRIFDNTLVELLDASERHKTAMVSPIIIDNNSIISFAGGFASDVSSMKITHYLSGKNMSYAPSEDYSVDVLHGCSVFSKIENFTKAGPIPEDYFLYYEETDWFLSMAKKGIDRIIVPSTTIQHNKKSHNNGIPSLYYLYYLTRNIIIFNKKFGKKVNSAISRHETEFVKPWLLKLEKSGTKYSKIFELTIKAALDDGKNGVLGKIDIGKRIEQVQNDCVVTKPKGFIEKFGATVVSGWIALDLVDREDSYSEQGVWLFIDDVPVEYCAANIVRKDVAAAGYSELSGFIFSIPSIYHFTGKRKVEVRCSKTAVRIPFISSNKLFEYVDFSNIKIDLVGAKSEFIGRVDSIIDNFLTGWVVDKSNRSRKVCVDIFLNEKKIDNIATDIYRKDVVKQGIGCGIHGIKILIPSEFQQEKSINVKMCINGKKDLIYEKTLNPKGSIDFFPNNIKDYYKWSYNNDLVPISYFEKTKNISDFFKSQKQSRLLASRRMTSQPLVSVIMPAYNRATTIKHAIDSVINQEYKNWELLIVDDGSQDMTSKIASDIIKDEKRCKLFILNENKGVSTARNFALKHAHGDIITYLDSDNEWYPEALSVFVQTLCSDSDYLCCYSGQEIWELSDNSSEERLLFFRGAPYNYGKLEIKNFIDLNVFAHRRELYDSLGGFREDIRRLVDWELILRYTRMSPPFFIPCLLVKYFVGRAKNQITLTEPFESNYYKIKIQPNVLKPFEPSVIDSETDFVVFCKTRQQAKTWVQLCLPFLKDKIDRVNMIVDNNGLLPALFFLNDNDFREECKNDIEQLIESRKRRDLFLLSGDILVMPGWQKIIYTAKQLLRVASATGRIFIQESSSSKNVINRDINSELIAKFAVSWNAHPKIHSIACSCLPWGGVWMSSDLSDVFLVNFLDKKYPQLALELTYNNSFFANFGAHVYLPEMKFRKL